ncbi:bifunctional glycosyltransferase/CDP-glycerol:glycerophosphate glycerophosphotransferase [Rothia sp. P6271]|uniref:bifunctional glycosyltransferase/CDP-glycerol:glycerophosphate glycerophosphotransferase n=1 Tax=Rothia sp. P6271 TaxID=3402659 RepID=UPI003AC12046
MNKQQFSCDVIIPAAEAHRTLRRAVFSVLESSFVKNVFIVIDAGLETARVAEEIASVDNRIRVLYTGDGNTPAERGVSVARNLGLAAVQSPWTAFLDADDQYDTHYFEAISTFLENLSYTPRMIHTRPFRVQDHEIFDNHPLRFRFEHGSRIVDIEQEPHMVGLSVAAAIFSTSALRASKTYFLEGAQWSEDADFMVRFLLATQGPIGFVAEAHYLYHVGISSSASADAWRQPQKYVEPFERLYLQWIRLSAPNIPVWLQNILIYELSWYINADRQIFHPSLYLAPEIRQKCASLIKTVAGSLSPQVIENYALTPLSLDRRMMILSCATQRHHSMPVLNQYLISYTSRRYQKGYKYIYFFQDEDLYEEFYTAHKKRIFPFSETWVSHTLYDVEFVKERVVWFDVPVTTAHINHRYIPVSPYHGFPKLPVPHLLNISHPQGTQINTNNGLSIKTVFARLRRKLWHLRHSRKKAKVSSTREKKNPLSLGDATQTSSTTPTTWVYMDRHHRAGDNAEDFYRYARQHRPDIRHLFILSTHSPDWERLQAEGFSLVKSEDNLAFKDAIEHAECLLSSDISDSSLIPHLPSLPLEAPLVFLQHGITQKQMWRWFNSRRIDLLVTSHPAETEAIICPGSSYRLSAPEILEVGMPRHDKLRSLTSVVSHRNILLIAPTWIPHVRNTHDARSFYQWLLRWGYEWVPQELFHPTSQLKPVFFVHPNMEPLLEKIEESLPFPIIFGQELPQYLARAQVVISDSSSILDEGHVIGVHGIIVRQKSLPDPLGFIKTHQKEGFTFVENLYQIPNLLEGLIKTHQRSPHTHQVHEKNHCRKLLESLENRLK